MNSRIFSPGKLLITGEYFVLDGAVALALPTQAGQELFFEEKKDNASLVFWEAFHQKKLWFSAIIDYQTWTVRETQNPEAAAFILKVLQQVQRLSEKKFQGDTSYFLKTNLQFPADYGLGSSSTLMNNLAEWAGTDPFLLNQVSLGGSGYDIAVAKEKSPLLFQLKPERKITRIHFAPTFAGDLIFIHLNKKQNSREGIRAYREKVTDPGLIRQISEITAAALAAKDLNSFSRLMVQHEHLVSSFLKIPEAKTLYFKDCPVFIKSLGAWGGDFIMSAKFEGYQAWFSERGFSTIFDYKDIIM